MTNEYNWTDNPTVSEISPYNPDVLNECLMHLKYNNMPSDTTLMSFNGGNVDAYGSADLIDAQLSTNVVFSQPGTYTLNIPVNGNYDVILVGGGAGGAWGMDIYATRSSSSGGSGAAFVGNIYLAAGTYSCSVGAGGTPAGNGEHAGGGGDTCIAGVISAGGGSAGAYATWGQQQESYGGVFAVNTTINSASVQSNGNNGTVTVNNSSNGGASLYNGYGKGGDATTSSAAAGMPGFLSVKLSVPSYINYKIGGAYQNLIGTLPDGNQFTVYGINSDDSSALADGTYYKYVGADGSCELLKNNFIISPSFTNPSYNDVWYNTALEPAVLLKWNGSMWEDYHKIPLGKFTISGGTVSGFKTFPYSSMKVDVPNDLRPNSIVKEYVDINSGSWYRLFADGMVEQGGFLTLQDSTDTVVTFPVPMSSFLNCFFSCTRGSGYDQYAYQLGFNGNYIVNNVNLGMVVRAVTNCTVAAWWKVMGKVA